MIKFVILTTTAMLASITPINAMEDKDKEERRHRALEKQRQMLEKIKKIPESQEKPIPLINKDIKGYTLVLPGLMYDFDYPYITQNNDVPLSQKFPMKKFDGPFLKPSFPIFSPSVLLSNFSDKEKNLFCSDKIDQLKEQSLIVKKAHELFPNLVANQEGWNNLEKSLSKQGQLNALDALESISAMFKTFNLINQKNPIHVDNLCFFIERCGDKIIERTSAGKDLAKRFPYFQWEFDVLCYQQLCKLLEYWADHNELVREAVSMILPAIYGSQPQSFKKLNAIMKGWSHNERMTKISQLMEQTENEHPEKMNLIFKGLSGVVQKSTYDFEGAFNKLEKFINILKECDNDKILPLFSSAIDINKEKILTVHSIIKIIKALKIIPSSRLSKITKVLKKLPSTKRTTKKYSHLCNFLILFQDEYSLDSFVMRIEKEDLTTTTVHELALHDPESIDIILNTVDKRRFRSSEIIEDLVLLPHSLWKDYTGSEPILSRFLKNFLPLQENSDLYRHWNQGLSSLNQNKALFIANYILNNCQSIGPLVTGDGVLGQKAIITKNVIEQIDDPKNPYYVYYKLLEKASAPIDFGQIKCKQQILGNKVVSLNPLGISQNPNKVLIDESSIPDITIEDYTKLLDNLEKRNPKINSRFTLTELLKRARREEVKQFLLFSNKDLSTIRFKALLKYIQSIQNEEQKDCQLVEFMDAVSACETRIGSGIHTLYLSMPSEAKLKTRTGLSCDVPEANFILEHIMDAMELLLQPEEDLVKLFCGVSKHERVSEPNHQAMYLRTLLIQVGFRWTHPHCDRHAGLIYEGIRLLSAQEATQKFYDVVIAEALFTITRDFIKASSSNELRIKEFKTVLECLQMNESTLWDSNEECTKILYDQVREEGVVELLIKLNQLKAYNSLFAN